MKGLLLGYLVAINLLAFGAFGFDKQRARRGGGRVSERRLLWFAFLLGAPGAWLGSRVFRHKTRKASFRAKLWLVTLLEVALVLAWFGWGRG